MDPTLFKEFCNEFTREMNRLRMEGSATIEAARSEVRRIERELDKLLELILKGNAGLGGYRVTACRKNFCDASCRQACLDGALSGAQTGTAGTDDDNVKRMIDERVCTCACRIHLVP
jgi:hypothetical protein